jgi:DNA polymerase III delta prime subunit
MAVWQENLKKQLQQKDVLIVHGNIRDSVYIRPDGSSISGLTHLLRDTARDLGYQRLVSWGVFFDSTGKGIAPFWSLERIEFLQDTTRQPEDRKLPGERKELQLLSRWLQEDVRDKTQRTMFVINYLDKLTPFNQRGAYSPDIAQYVILIEKIIENMSDNNRLVLVALQDTLVPQEYYTNSPRVSVVEVPLPDKAERGSYFSKWLGRYNLPIDRIDFLSNVTDGLYARDLENILRDIGRDCEKTADMGYSHIRRVVNRYRIGSEDDPWGKLPLSDHPKGLIGSADNWFKERVIGQDYAVEEVVKVIKKARAGVVGLASGQASKPRGVFFFAGPTGVGKTFLAKKLAEFLFDTEEAFVRFDMSEFKEEHAVSKLIGAPPGYVGYEKGGELTNRVRNRPFSVILFDEIEKAHPKIMDIFLQILDDGRLTDSRGQTIFFTESVVVFTSNIGTRSMDSRGRDVSEKSILEHIMKEKIPVAERSKQVRQHFVESVQEYFTYEISRPELLNRIGSNIIAFNYIDAGDSLERIIISKLKDIEDNFKDKFSNQGFRLTFASNVQAYFKEKYGDAIARFGGRGLVNAIDDEVSYQLADKLLIAEKNRQHEMALEVLINDRGELKCRSL